MKITATRQALLDALLVVSRAVSDPRRAPGPLRDPCSPPTASRACAPPTWSSASTSALEGEAEGAGAVVLPGRLLVEVARSLPDGSVTLELRESERDVEITAGSSKFHLRTIPADDFPRFPETEGDPIELPAPALQETIGRVARAASRDEARPVLTGVLVTAEEKELTMVATDSYRLAVKRTELDARGRREARGEHPGPRAAGAGAADRGGPGGARCRSGSPATRPCSGSAQVSLSSRLIDGQFPNYRQLLPESFEHEVKLPRAELLEVIRRVSQLAQRNAALRMSFSEGELVVSAETPDLGDAREALPAPYSGELLEIGFNPEFVRDGLESIDVRRGRAEADLAAAARG